MTSKQGIQTRVKMFIPDWKCEADEDEARKPLADSEFVAYKATENGSHFGKHHVIGKFFDDSLRSIPWPSNNLSSQSVASVRLRQTFQAQVLEETALRAWLVERSWRKAYI